MHFILSSDKDRQTLILGQLLSLPYSIIYPTADSKYFDEVMVSKQSWIQNQQSIETCSIKWTINNYHHCANLNANLTRLFSREHKSN